MSTEVALVTACFGILVACVGLCNMRKKWAIYVFVLGLALIMVGVFVPEKKVEQTPAKWDHSITL
jgi:hypothetical membrane protein